MRTVATIAALALLCASPAWAQAPVCNDGIDNDGDGLTDYPEDPNCPFPEYRHEDTNCNDGIDNDGEGQADLNDDECLSSTQGYERFDYGRSQCFDDRDNDGDGLIDFPADDGCSSRSGIFERPPTGNSVCDNGVDDDTDGYIDFPDDPDCRDFNDNSELFDADEPPRDGGSAGTDTSNYQCNGDCVCASDTDGSGDIDQDTEYQACDQYPDGTVCPVTRRQCSYNGAQHSCPSDPSLACIPDADDNYYCSNTPCYPADAPPTEDFDLDEPDTPEGPIDEEGNCLGELRLFTGKGQRCRRSGTQTQWQNCCDNDNGRLDDTVGAEGEPSQGEYKDEANNFEIGGNQCDVQDQQTAQLEDSGYCISLGSYCAERYEFIGCVQRARSYCCFNSKLARIIQEQGRAQLPDMPGFGGAKSPQCRGFTLEEFQSIDFSKIDLTEYESSIRTQSQAIMEQEGRDAVLDDFR